jgi:hypothetical protein
VSRIWLPRVLQSGSRTYPAWRRTCERVHHKTDVKQKKSPSRQRTLRTYELRLLNQSLSSSSLFASSINVLAASKIISMLCPLAKRSRRARSSEVAVFRPPSYATKAREYIKKELCGQTEHRRVKKAYGSESGMTLLAVSSNRLPMTGVLLSIR